MNQKFRLTVINAVNASGPGKAIPLQTILRKMTKEHQYTPSVKSLGHSDEKDVFHETVKEKRESVAWNAASCMSVQKRRKTAGGFLHLRKDGLCKESIEIYLDELKHKEYVIGVWESLGSTCLECLIRCDELEARNFDSIREQIIEAIGLDFEYEGVTQLKISPISYCPDTIWNLKATNFPLRKSIVTKVVQHDWVQLPLPFQEDQKSTKQNSDNKLGIETHTYRPFLFDENTMHAMKVPKSNYFTLNVS